MPINQAGTSTSNVADTTCNPDQALTQAQSFGATEPFNTIIGPMKERGALNGLIVRGGYVVAEWGDTTRVDMTHSVTKTYLSTVVGLAWQKGLIRDVHDRVRDYMPSDVALFDAAHNQPITWDHLLRQTSDWQGVLWGKPDWADRPADDLRGELERERQRPADVPILELLVLVVEDQGRQGRVRVGVREAVEPGDPHPRPPTVLMRWAA